VRLLAATPSRVSSAAAVLLRCVGLCGVATKYVFAKRFEACVTCARSRVVVFSFFGVSRVICAASVWGHTHPGTADGARDGGGGARGGGRRAARHHGHGGRRGESASCLFDVRALCRRYSALTCAICYVGVRSFRSPFVMVICVCHYFPALAVACALKRRRRVHRHCSVSCPLTLRSRAR
jgi:hypothetical protein